MGAAIVSVPENSINITFLPTSRSQHLERLVKSFAKTELKDDPTIQIGLPPTFSKMECGMYSLHKVYVEASALSSIYINSSTIYMKQKYIFYREYAL